MTAALLTLNEVAELSGASRRLVEKAIEERVLSARSAASPPMGRSRRMLPAFSVAYAAALKRLELNLSITHKKRLARIMEKTPMAELRTKRVTIAPAVEIDIGQLAGEAMDRMEKYQAARDAFIVADPDIKGGTPVIRGTRMSVYLVLGRTAHGESVAAILADNPDLRREAVEAAVIYARAHPLVGRPGGRPWAHGK
jgi:uncharacterized protein (DUF433 family)